MYRAIKTYGNERGFSCVFRQHKAKSHCRFLHGYSLGFRFTFECTESELTPEGWVVDFGGLKKLEQKLRRFYDHMLVIAADDPLKQVLGNLEGHGLADTRYAYDTGCEAFAKEAFHLCRGLGLDSVISVECFEHGANSAIYTIEGV